ncbi:hypothetical protein AMTRI_Chr13g86770 [Amborella trichopoda]
MAGKCTLLKASLANTPIYFMLLFQIPASVAKRIEQLKRNFLWSSSAETKKIHLVSQKQICSDKKKGGLGIRDIRKQNWALLRKWWWRLADNENQLWTQVIRSKYKISSQKWLPKTDSYSTRSGIWKTLISILPYFELNELFLPLSRTDSIIWSPSSSRRFSMASFYRVLVEATASASQSNRAWNSIAPPRTKLFQWLAFQGNPLTLDNLQKRAFQFPNRCIMCLSEEETVTHLLLHCYFAYSIWSQTTQLFGLSWVLPHSVQALLLLSFEDSFRKSGKILWKASVATILCHIWGERNSKIFRGKMNTPHTTF